MVKCPKCGEEISELILYTRGETKSKFLLDQDGNAQKLELDDGWIPMVGFLMMRPMRIMNVQNALRS